MYKFKVLLFSLVYYFFLFPFFYSTVEAQNTTWWDNRWSARFPITINPQNQAYIDKGISITIDFSGKMNQAQFPTGNTLDINSIRVIDPQTTAVILPSQVETTTNNNHLLSFVMTGTVNTTKTYYVYFDSAANASNKPSPPEPSLKVTATDNVTYLQHPSVRINTPNGTYYYHKDGGGFASYLDSQNADWLSYNATVGSAGTYRGIPNMVYPDGFFHPGETHATSTLLSSGPVKATIESISNNNAWKVRWDIFPTYAFMTVLQKPQNQPYWFLYEGTPGGSIDSNDFYFLPDGQQKAIGTAFTQDISGPEFAYFGDTSKNIVLFVASGQNDTHTDSYYLMQNNMTVFGFGRQNTNRFLQQAPATFSFGFAPKTTHATVTNYVQSSIQNPSNSIGNAERYNATTTPTPTQSVTITPTPTISSTSCNAKFKGDADCRPDPAGRAVTLLDYAIWYAEFINACASTNLGGCGNNADGTDTTMDANFNFPGSNHIATDLKVDVFDYAAWIQGYTTQ